MQSVNTGLTDAIENSQLLPIVDEKAGLTNANVTNDPTENTGKARSTIDVDACQLNTCENLGKCTDLDGIDVSAAGRSCDCSLTGFIGASCDENINECDSNPCKNFFSCIDATLDYVCDCSESTVWSGKNCNYDEFCDDQSCSGNGVCSNGNCRCESGYSGVTCSEFICDRVDCSGNGACEFSQISGSVNCVCNAGWEGPDCLDGVCFENQCNAAEINGAAHGVCVPVGRGYTCDCFNGYTGIFCDIMPGVEATTRDTSETTTTKDGSTSVNDTSVTDVTVSTSTSTGGFTIVGSSNGLVTGIFVVLALLVIG